MRSVVNQNWGQKRRNSNRSRLSPLTSIYSSYEKLPKQVKHWLGYRVSLNTIANAKLLKEKKKIWDPDRSTQENSHRMRDFMGRAREGGFYRNYSGLVISISEAESLSLNIANRKFLTIQLDESCRDPEDVTTITLALKESRWDNWQRLPPRTEDLMEMMTSSNDLLREFAVKFYKENDEAAGTVLELLTKMDPDARLDILSQFCRNCGRIKCNCS